MMKYRKLFTVLAIVMLMGITAVLNACGDPNKGKHKVEFMDMDGTVISTEYVDNDGVAKKPEDPTKADKDFMGWFRSEAYTVKFDFETKITRDTKIFAGFRTTAYTEDTRQWAIAGSGKGSILYTSSFGKNVSDAHRMTKKSTAGVNEYELTINLFVDDKFQFIKGASNNDWSNQRGGAYMQTLTHEGAEAFAYTADSAYGQNPRTADILVKKAGKYKFTLTTYPADDISEGDKNANYWDTIVWERLGDVDEDPVSTVTNYYIKGANISHWDDIFAPYQTLNVSVFNTVYTTTVYLEQGDQIMFLSSRVDVSKPDDDPTLNGANINAADLDDSSKTHLTGTNNITVNTSGVYTFTIDLSKAVGQRLNAVKTTQERVLEDFYINGKIDGNATWAINGIMNDYKLTRDGSTENYKITMEFAEGDVFNVVGFKAGSTEEGAGWINKTGDYDYKYSVNSRLIEPEAPANNNYNIKISEAGEYEVNINAYSKRVTVTAPGKQEVYIKGNMDGNTLWEFSWEDELKFTEVSDGVFELTFEFVAGDELCVVFFNYGEISGRGTTVVGANITFCSGVELNGSNNIKVTTAGTYKLTYTQATATVVITTA